jgi:hypothetical protein
MKILLFVPLLLALLIPQQTSTSNTSSVEVVSYKWTPARRTVENAEANGIVPPASAMIPQNKNFARNVRMNEPAGVRDPNADTVDGRSAELEKAVQQSRAPKTKTVDGFSYRAKVRNTAEKAIEILFWEYQFFDPLAPETLTRHQFLCGVDIRSGKDKELEGFTITAPSNVVNVDTLAKGTKSPFQEKIVINRVEYVDGSIWQRPDWSLKELKASYERALHSPWVPGMCKPL